VSVYVICIPPNKQYIYHMFTYYIPYMCPCYEYCVDDYCRPPPPRLELLLPARLCLEWLAGVIVNIVSPLLAYLMY
jgi:hypothetical protein